MNDGRNEVEDSELTRVDEPPPEQPKEDRKRLRDRIRRKKGDEPLSAAFGGDEGT